MQLTHSELWNPVSINHVNDHMKSFTDEGWELASANAGFTRIGLDDAPVHFFYWRKAEPR